MRARMGAPRDIAAVTVAHRRRSLVLNINAENRLCNTTGGCNIALQLRNFGYGPHMATQTIMASYSNDEFTFPAVDCWADYDGETVRCVNVPGVGANHRYVSANSCVCGCPPAFFMRARGAARVIMIRWLVSINNITGHRSASAANTMTAYERPVIMDVRAANNQSHTLSPAGGDNFTMRGENFGVTDLHGALRWVKYWPYDSRQYVFTASSCRVTVSHVEIQCSTTAGVGRRLRFGVNIGGQTSYIPQMTYDAPVVESIDVVSYANGSAALPWVLGMQAIWSESWAVGLPQTPGFDTTGGSVVRVRGR
jgi:hypothetical protein